VPLQHEYRAAAIFGAHDLAITDFSRHGERAGIVGIDKATVRAPSNVASPQASTRLTTSGPSPGPWNSGTRDQPASGVPSIEGTISRFSSWKPASPMKRPLSLSWIAQKPKPSIDQRPKWRSSRCQLSSRERALPPTKRKTAGSVHMAA